MLKEAWLYIFLIALLTGCNNTSDDVSEDTINPNDYFQDQYSRISFYSDFNSGDKIELIDTSGNNELHLISLDDSQKVEEVVIKQTINDTFSVENRITNISDSNSQYDIKFSLTNKNIKLSFLGKPQGDFNIESISSNLDKHQKLLEEFLTLNKISMSQIKDSNNNIYAEISIPKTIIDLISQTDFTIFVDGKMVDQAPSNIVVVEDDPIIGWYFNDDFEADDPQIFYRIKDVAQSIFCKDRSLSFYQCGSSDTLSTNWDYFGWGDRGTLSVRDSVLTLKGASGWPQGITNFNSLIEGDQILTFALKVPQGSTPDYLLSEFSYAGILMSIYSSTNNSFDIHHKTRTNRIVQEGFKTDTWYFFNIAINWDKEEYGIYEISSEPSPKNIKSISFLLDNSGGLNSDITLFAESATAGPIGTRIKPTYWDELEIKEANFN